MTTLPRIITADEVKVGQTVCIARVERTNAVTYTGIVKEIDPYAHTAFIEEADRSGCVPIRFLSTDCVVTITLMAEAPEPKPPYATGALYRVWLSSAKPQALWRTDDGWTWREGGSTGYFDAHYPDATAERIWTYDPKTEVVVKRDDKYVSPRDLARHYRTIFHYVTADLWDRYADGLERGETR